MDRAQVVFGVASALVFYISYVILKVVWEILYFVTQHISDLVFFLLVLFLLLPASLILSRAFTKHFFPDYHI